jgi:hypothetical protein
MNKIVIFGLAMSLAACSSIKKDEKSESKSDSKTTQASQPATPYSQRMVTSFKRKGIKFEWSCVQGADGCNNPEVIAIEVTGYATSNGPSENSRNSALKAATLQAKATLRRFINEEISTTTVSKTFTKNIEKSTEQFKASSKESGVVSVDDDNLRNNNENNSLSDRNNITVQTVTDTVRSSASGILKAVYVIDEEIIDNNHVSATIRWDRKMENINQYLQNRFGN